jgi:hypothetical protein
MSDDYQWQGFPGEAEMVRAKRAAAAKAHSPSAPSTSSGQAPSDPSTSSGQAGSGQAGAVDSVPSTPAANPAQASSGLDHSTSSGPGAQDVSASDGQSTRQEQAHSTGSGQEPLSQKQQAALAELQSGTPFKTAAERVGVHQATLYRWIKSDPTFRAAYNLWEQATRESARAKLLAAADIAAKRVIDKAEFDPKFAFALLKEMGIFRQRPAGQIDPEPARQEIELEMKTDLAALKARLAQLAELADARKPVQSRVVRSVAHEQPAAAPAEGKCEKCESIGTDGFDAQNGK